MKHIIVMTNSGKKQLSCFVLKSWHDRMKYREVLHVCEITDIHIQGRVIYTYNGISWKKYMWWQCEISPSVLMRTKESDFVLVELLLSTVLDKIYV